MKKIENLALVAHDNRKVDLIEWVENNADKLLKYNLTCTGTTGKLVEEALTKLSKGKELLQMTKLKSGPLGGDQQLGSLICEGKIDMIIFLWDPMQPQPHDVDVKALLRIAVLYNIPIANNRSTADFLITSSLLEKEYEIKVKDYSSYIHRKL